MRLTRVRFPAEPCVFFCRFTVQALDRAHNAPTSGTTAPCWLVGSAGGLEFLKAQGPAGVWVFSRVVFLQYPPLRPWPLLVQTASNRIKGAALPGLHPGRPAEFSTRCSLQAPRQRGQLGQGGIRCQNGKWQSLQFCNSEMPRPSQKLTRKNVSFSNSNSTRSWPKGSCCEPQVKFHWGFPSRSFQIGHCE